MGRTQSRTLVLSFVWFALQVGSSIAADATAPSAVGQPFTIVAIPDSQHLVQKYPHIFTAQTRWIRDNADAENIVFVTHEGDVVQDADEQEEWEEARESMDLLNGVVPYGIAPGNHDQDIHRGSTLYEDYFGAENYSDESWYGGSYPPGTNWNSFQTFSASGVDFLMLHLEFCPSEDAVAWADTVLKAHPDRRAIVTTHAFLRYDGSFSARHCPEVGETGSTEWIWEELVESNDNVYMVLCGHDYPTNNETPGEVTQTHIVNEGTSAEREVHVMLANYQNIDKTGRSNRGFLRLLRFVPATDTIEVSTYSPFLDTYRTEPESEFELSFPLGVSGGGFEEPSADTVSFLRGDCNADGIHGVGDAVFQLDYSFFGGDRPGCLAACDTNGDASLSGVADAVYLLNFKYLGGNAPPAPFPACGLGTDNDLVLGCETTVGSCPEV